MAAVSVLPMAENYILHRLLDLDDVHTKFNSFKHDYGDVNKAVLRDTKEPETNIKLMTPEGIVKVERTLTTTQHIPLSLKNITVTMISAGCCIKYKIN
jgi:hypothetical protein